MDGTKISSGNKDNIAHTKNKANPTNCVRSVGSFSQPRWHSGSPIFRFWVKSKPLGQTGAPADLQATKRDDGRTKAGSLIPVSSKMVPLVNEDKTAPEHKKQGSPDCESVSGSDRPCRTFSGGFQNESDISRYSEGIVPHVTHFVKSRGLKSTTRRTFLDPLRATPRRNYRKGGPRKKQHGGTLHWQTANPSSLNVAGTST